MEEIYKIPQLNLPSSKPNWNAHHHAKRLAEAKLKEKSRKILSVKPRPVGKIRYLYLLELEHGMFYIGSTCSVRRRFEYHKRGEGAKWTQIHRPIRILEQRCLGRMSAKDACKLEQVMFDEYFLKYGYALRGAGKCQVNPRW